MTKQINLCIFLLQLGLFCLGQGKLYVASNGSDKNSGTITKPFKTPAFAISKAIALTGTQITIEIRGGIYELEKPIEITSSSYQVNSLTLRAYKNEKVIISGSKQISLQWQSDHNGLLKASLNLHEAPDRLFMNGHPLCMARYPNYDYSARNFNGTAADAISEQRVKSWKNPVGGYSDEPLRSRYEGSRHKKA